MQFYGCYFFHYYFYFSPFPGRSSNQERKGRERLLPSVSGRTVHHVLLMGIKMPSSVTRSQVTV